jgi:hypothetical protein
MRRYIGNPNISFVLDSKLLHDKIIETRNSYHFVISKINFPKIDFIYDANNLINEDMEKAIVITDKNVQAISNLAYKIEFSQKNTKDYNEIVNSIITSSREMNLCHIIS